MGATRACVAAVVLLLFLDFCWLYLLGAGSRFMAVARSLEVTARPPWQLVIVVVAAYILLGCGLCVFAVWPAIDALHSWRAAAWRGALLGLLVYGVYDLTNLAVFGQAYGLGLALSDVAWGVFVFGVAALGGAMAA